ncbi:MAG: endonuclease/exonuclease/phosphatase family protein [Planctomycetota bacterium]
MHTRFAWFWTTALACLIACPACADPTKVTVMTYNVQNFFDEHDDPYTEDSDRPKDAASIRLIAAAIAAADADVIAFQEIERGELLQAMVDRHLRGKGYEYVELSMTNSDRGIQLGVVSRLPIDRIASYRTRTLVEPGFPRRFRFARDVMHVTLDAGEGRTIELLNLHLKSNRTVADDDRNSMKWRSAEAREARKIALELAERKDAYGKSYVLVLGDFNSDFEMREGDQRPWPATAILRSQDEQGGLVDVHDGLPREARVTLPGRGRYPPAVFDFILASSDLAELLVDGSSKVMQQERFADGSDHKPVVATFMLPGVWAGPP